jgi:hypothetical protein
MQHAIACGGHPTPRVMGPTAIAPPPPRSAGPGIFGRAGAEKAKSPVRWRAMAWLSPSSRSARCPCAARSRHAVGPACEINCTKFRNVKRIGRGSIPFPAASQSVRQRLSGSAGLRTPRYPNKLPRELRAWSLTGPAAAFDTPADSTMSSAKTRVDSCRGTRRATPDHVQAWATDGTSSGFGC